MIRVCSGWSPKGRTLYGQNFLASFDKNWSPSIDLKVYVEESHQMPRDACRLLWDIPGAREFMDRHKDDQFLSGRKKRPESRWKATQIQAGYSFRFDAMKFFKQIIIPDHAAQDMADGDILIWLDGDVVTTKPVTEEAIFKIIRDAEICYLGRERSHSEIGFYAVRLNAKTRAFLKFIADMYRTDAFLDLEEHHSAFIHDYGRKQADMLERNLTPGGRGHVWERSPLAAWSLHLKGKRKGIEK